jgi:ATP-binding cassette subfamily F protein 3
LLAQISDQIGGSNEEERLLTAFGLEKFSAMTPVAHLSGGQKTRLALARVLRSQPDLLLLDEPTNHLDIEMLEWLESWLTKSPATVLFISHDRSFIDHAATTVLDLDPVSHKTRQYAGNYSAYIEQKQTEREHQLKEFSDQQVEIARLTMASAHLRDLARFRKGGKADSGDKFAKGFFANRGLETVKRAKSIEKKIDHFLTDGHIEKPGQTWQMKIEFGETQNSGRDVLSLENLTIGYPDDILIQNVQLVIRNHQRVVLIGSNGSGKTSLLRTIAGQIPPICGTVRIGTNIQIGYLAQEQLDLDEVGNALEIISAIKGRPETEVRSFLSKYLFKGDDVYTPYSRMSYGERVRLALAALVEKGINFMLLDEPINHLDIPARIRFEEALKQFPGTILAVVHDRYFIHSFATNIWEVKDRAIRIIA